MKLFGVVVFLLPLFFCHTKIRDDTMLSPLRSLWLSWIISFLFLCGWVVLFLWLRFCFFAFVAVVLFCVTRDCDCSGLCKGPFPLHFCAPFAAGLCAHLICLFSVSSQHAMEHVERPGESQEASEGKKKSCGRLRTVANGCGRLRP